MTSLPFCPLHQRVCLNQICVRFTFMSVMFNKAESQFSSINAGMHWNHDCILYRTVGSPASLKHFLFQESVQMTLGKWWWRNIKQKQYLPWTEWCTGSWGRRTTVMKEQRAIWISPSLGASWLIRVETLDWHILEVHVTSWWVHRRFQ